LNSDLNDSRRVHLEGFFEILVQISRLGEPLAGLPFPRLDDKDLAILFGRMVKHLAPGEMTCPDIFNLQTDRFLPEEL